MPIHGAITRKVKPGNERAFEESLREFFQESLHRQGVLGVHLLSPPPGSGSREYRVLRTFADERERDEFYRSDLFKRCMAPLVPWLVGFLIGLAIALLGTSTGGSSNPARQFGPAAVSGQTRFLWVYQLAPMLGAVIGAWLRQTIHHSRAVLTHRLCGTHADGSWLSDFPTSHGTSYSTQRAGGR